MRSERYEGNRDDCHGYDEDGDRLRYAEQEQIVGEIVQHRESGDEHGKT